MSTRIDAYANRQRKGAMGDDRSVATHNEQMAAMVLGCRPEDVAPILARLGYVKPCDRCLGTGIWRGDRSSGTCFDCEGFALRVLPFSDRRLREALARIQRGELARTAPAPAWVFQQRDARARRDSASSSTGWEMHLAAPGPSMLLNYPAPPPAPPMAMPAPIGPPPPQPPTRSAARTIVGSIAAMFAALWTLLGVAGLVGLSSKGELHGGHIFVLVVFFGGPVAGSTFLSLKMFSRPR